jgi:hypothetical protein
MTVKIKIPYLFLTLGLLSLLGSACNKTDFLSSKPQQNLEVPSSLSDFQAILDNNYYMNGNNTYGAPTLGFIACDDYYFTDANYLGSLNQWVRNVYTWAGSPYPGLDIIDWDYPYRTVFYANVVLDGIPKITPAANEVSTWNNIKGSALFYRAFMFFELAETFAPVFDSASAATDLGIPLRLSADVNEKLVRASVKDTYSQILNDLTEAKKLLPTVPIYKSRPSRVAVNGLLARVYLNMRNYSLALQYADSCLQEYHQLLNYNELNASATYPISQYNSEVIFDEEFFTNNYSVEKVDTVLYNSYDTNDLRKLIFFKKPSTGGIRFYGSYTGNTPKFSGISTDEMYLIRAECYARIGNTVSAMTDLDTLLQNRWKTGTFIPLQPGTSQNVLELVLQERRKELLYRNLRWQDVRRLNKEGANITLQRIANGQIYVLPPNDLRYIFPIPDNVLSLNPAIIQNPR